MELKKIVELKGTIKVLTGLHIGGNKDDIEIGGIDIPVIKDKDGLPYIPGSSLKGKMRSLKEYAEGLVNGKGEVHSCSEVDCMLCKVFGSSTKEIVPDRGPTRIIVRDAKIKDEIVNNFDFLTEEKVENTINRLTGKAEHPRHIERIIPGVEFIFSIGIKIFNDDDEEKLIKYVKDSLELIQDDYLGGNGSRGYGQVEINIEKEKVKDIVKSKDGQK